MLCFKEEKKVRLLKLKPSKPKQEKKNTETLGHHSQVPLKL